MGVGGRCVCVCLFVGWVARFVFLLEAHYLTEVDGMYGSSSCMNGVCSDVDVHGYNRVCNIVSVRV